MCSLKTSQASVDLNWNRGQSIHARGDRGLYVAKIGYGLGLTIQCRLDFSETVLNHDNTTVKGDEIVRNIFNLVFLSFHDRVCGVPMDLEPTNF